MDDWEGWYLKPPPRDTWVWAAYSLERGDWQLVKTCKRGCCVHSAFGTQVLPNFWKPATAEEGATEQGRWDAMPKIDMADLYGL